MLKVPDLLRRPALRKEQQVGIDARVRVEHSFGQAHDGMQVARAQQVFLQARLHALAEQRPIGQHHRALPAILQQFHDHRQEQVGGLLGLELLREVLIHARFLHAAKRRVGQDHIHLVVFIVILIRTARQRVIVDHLRHLDIVQNQVRGA